MPSFSHFKLISNQILCLLQILFVDENLVLIHLLCLHSKASCSAPHRAASSPLSEAVFYLVFTGDLFVP